MLPIFENGFVRTGETTDKVVGELKVAGGEETSGCTRVTREASSKERKGGENDRRDEDVTRAKNRSRRPILRAGRSATVESLFRDRVQARRRTNRWE